MNATNVPDHVKKSRAHVGYWHGYRCRCTHDARSHDAIGCHERNCACRKPAPCPCGHPDVCHDDDGNCYECHKDNDRRFVLLWSKCPAIREDVIA